MNRRKISVLAALLLCVALGALMVFMALSPAPHAQPAPAIEASRHQVAAQPEVTLSDSAGTIDLAAALAPRSLGDPNAPLKLEEFASLNCGHCAHFARDVFPKLKKGYIDTGKLYYTFTDFPLNAPALAGSVVARCVPRESYFSFLDFLFGSVEKWSFEGNYADILIQSGKLAGGDEETLRACLMSDPLKIGIVEKMQQAGEAHGIDSTPSFLLNDKTVIKGALPYKELQKILDGALKE